MKDEINSQPVKHVIEHIKKQISERQILPGERLPSERKLSELLKVSRSCSRGIAETGIIRYCKNISSEWNSGIRILQRPVGYYDYRCIENQQI